MNKTRRVAGTVAVALFLGGMSMFLQAQGDGAPYVLLMGKQRLYGRLTYEECTGLVGASNPAPCMGGQWITVDGIEFKDQDTGVSMDVSADLSSLSIAAVRYETGHCKGRPIAKLTLMQDQTFTGCLWTSATFVAGTTRIQVPAPGGEIKLIRDGSASPSITGASGTVARPQGEVRHLQQATIDSNSQAETAESEIAKIRGGRYAAMPAAEASPDPASGRTRMVFENETPYELTVYFSDGVIDTIHPNSTMVAPLAMVPGHYEVAARLSNRAITPFYGVEDFAADTKYSWKFHVQARSH